MKRIILAFTLACLASGAWAQVGTGSLEGYFRNPMDGTLLPSANFAETRPNHFHSGVDIKTGGAEGKQLYAAADGYISRIGIVPGGFGRVLYINHPNGTTTVYAHMQRFTAAIEKYVTAERYRQKKHNVDIYLDARTFPVKKGDPIGLSGNSGRSGGPHLHYEIRDAATQEPVNPIVRKALVMKDDIPPTIVKLHYIEVDTVGGVPLNSKPRAIGAVKKPANRYALSDTSALAVGPRGYFVLETTDRKNDTHNTMGIYRVRMRMDGDELFGFDLDRYNYADTRYVNSLCHFALQKGSSNQLIRLALQENNRLPVYSKMKNRGLVIPGDDLTHDIVIEVTDDNGNTATLDFAVRRSETRFQPDSDTDGIALDCLKPFTATLEGLRVSIPQRALYESVYYRHDREDNPALKNGNTASIPRFSPVYRVHDASVPLHRAIEISIVPERLPERLREKACLGIVSADGSNISYIGGSYKDGRITGSSSLFGRFCVVADTVPPTIVPNFRAGQDLRPAKSLTLTVKDDFSGVGSFTATIDGEWIIFEQNVMKNTITHVFDPARVKYNGGKHTLVITVTDNKGNAASLKREFIR